MDNTSLNAFYVYVYYDPRKAPAEPIYVGKGHGNRAIKHIKKSQNVFLNRKIAKIREENLEPLIKYEFENLTEEQSFDKEKELIKFYGRQDLGTGTLCNFTDGGEGTFGRECSPETRQLFSSQRKNKKQTPAQYEANCNRKHSDEARKKISQATKGHSWHTPEQIEIIREHSKNRIISDKTRQLWSQQRKGVIQTPEHVEKVKQAKAVADAKRLEEMGPEEFSKWKNRGSEKCKGQKRSEETKAKMRLAWERRRASQKIDS